jgi:hypothetical protein
LQFSLNQGLETHGGLPRLFPPPTKPPPTPDRFESRQDERQPVANALDIREHILYRTPST